jgi:hypothetical protein
MNFDGWMGFERSGTGRMIQVWEDDGNGTALSTNVEVPVTTLQNVLRGCDAMDEGTIGFFDAAAINVRAFQLQNTACVLQHLGIQRL